MKNKYIKLNILLIVIIILFLLLIVPTNIEQFIDNSNNKIYLINYANRGFVESRRKLKKSALENGVDEVFEYNLSDIDEDYKNKNSKHFLSERGGGYWVWKPYIILKTFHKIKYNDIVIYSDSGATILKSLTPYIELLNKYSIILFNTQYDPSAIENKYTKMDIFIELNCNNNKDITNTRQIESGFLICKKDKNSIEFINKWLDLVQKYNLVSDEVSKGNNFPEFIAHRHDQSLLSVLGKLYKDKYNILIYSGEKDFIDHHRKRE